MSDPKELPAELHGIKINWLAPRDGLLRACFVDTHELQQRGYEQEADESVEDFLWVLGEAAKREAALHGPQIVRRPLAAAPPAKSIDRPPVEDDEEEEEEAVSLLSTSEACWILLFLIIIAITIFLGYYLP